MSFQKTVNLRQNPAVAGDFASSGIAHSVPAKSGTLIAGTGGVTCGRFAWVASDGTVLNSAASGVPDGIIPRTMGEALITAYLAESSNLTPVGFPTTVMDRGDFYITSTVAAATRGQKAFASLTDGTMQPGAAGATISGYVETRFYIETAAAIGDLAIVSTR